MFKGLRVQGIRVEGLGFRIEGVGLKGLEFSVLGLRGLGFGV